MSYGKELDLLAVGLETTPGTPVTPTAAVRWRSMKVTPKASTTGEKIATGDFGQSEKYVQERLADVEAMAYLSLPSGLTTAPDWSTMAAMCGWARTAHGSTGQSWSLRSGAGAVAPHTVWGLMKEEGATPRQQATRVKGVMGNMKIVAAQSFDVIKMEMAALGGWYGQADIANGSIISLGSVPTTRGMQLGGWSAVLQGYTCRLDNFEIDPGAKYEMLTNQGDASLTGIDYVRVTGAAPKGKVSMQLPPIADFDWRAAFVDGTVGSLILSNQGSGASLFQIRAPRAQIVNVEFRELNGGYYLDASLEFLRNGSSDATMNADDMIELLHGSKT